MFSFHNPGPGGTTSGTVTHKRTAQWSEKGHRIISHDETEGTHTYGQPTRSIREKTAVQMHPSVT